MNHWFLAAGDFIFFWEEQIRALSWLPRIWRAEGGFGWSSIQTLWHDYPFRVFIKLLDAMGLSWWTIEKILWLSVFALGIYASYKLSRYVLSDSRFSCLTPVVYIANTYFLLLFGGGQLGVALAYGLSPLVLLKFIQFIDSYSDLRHACRQAGFTMYDVRIILKNGLLLALLICFDLRLAYLVMGAVVLYLVLRIVYDYGQKTINNKQNALSAFCSLLFAVCVAAMFHLFWILPLVMVRGGLSGFGEDFTNSGMLTFLSFADFSHALSLLAPNWPENLFGKVYFLQPEFLVLPLLAFSALGWKKQKTENNKQDEFGRKAIINKQSVLSDYCLLSIRYFAILALLGVFLAKGAHEPFGGIYVWLFKHVPGFVMFRDPTKFYLFIALGYSVLIPFTLLQASHWINDKGLLIKDNTNKTRSFIMYLSAFIFIVFWLFSIRALFTGQVAGNFRPLKLTQEYAALKDMIAHDDTPYRTLWMPKADKFLYSSDLHPMLTTNLLWKNASVGALLTIIKSPAFLKTIEAGGVRYIIVPEDLEKRMFLSDYQFDKGQRDELIETISETGLPRLPEFQELVIFENSIYTFKVDIPTYVEKQEYWATVGVFVSGSMLIISVGWVWILSRKFKTP